MEIPRELRVGRAGHAFDHLGGFGDQAEAAAASGATIIYATGLGGAGYSGLPPQTEFATAAGKCSRVQSPSEATRHRTGDRLPVRDVDREARHVRQELDGRISRTIQNAAGRVAATGSAGEAARVVVWRRLRAGLHEQSRLARLRAGNGSLPTGDGSRRHVLRQSRPCIRRGVIARIA